MLLASVFNIQTTIFEYKKIFLCPLSILVLELLISLFNRQE